MGSVFLLGRAWERLGPSFFECVDLHCVGSLKSPTRSLPVEWEIFTIRYSRRQLGIREIYLAVVIVSGSLNGDL